MQASLFEELIFFGDALFGEQADLPLWHSVLMNHLTHESFEVSRS